MDMNLNASVCLGSCSVLNSKKMKCPPFVTTKGKLGYLIVVAVVWGFDTVWFGLPVPVSLLHRRGAVVCSTRWQLWTWLDRLNFGLRRCDCVCFCL